MTVFTITRHFLQWSDVAALTAAVASGTFTLLDHVLDLIKKSLEIRKLALEAEKLRAEVELKRRIVKPATPDEVNQFVSYKERKLRAYYRIEAEKEALPPSFDATDDT